MSQNFFNINYEFDREAVHRAIAERIERCEPGYICVADGVILDTANRNPEYREVVNGSMFSICDSSYVPLYIRLIHGIKLKQYSGFEIFDDIVRSRRYRMMFLGASSEVLEALQKNLEERNPDVRDMNFFELPFCEADGFDYPEIARMVDEDGAEIIWVALGAPKQEYFMNRLLPHLSRGVMIAVGAAFKFHSGLKVNRAPEWMVRHHLEFMHRIWKEPRKQVARCASIISSLPRILAGEIRKK